SGSSAAWFSPARPRRTGRGSARARAPMPTAGTCPARPRPSARPPIPGSGRWPRSASARERMREPPMSGIDLPVLWFILIALLFAGYFQLEGFDFGVGILLPFLGRDEARRSAMIRTIGPVWDGNEVWLITAGGALFAAFPEWYADMFSGFYLPLFLILLGLIVRIVGLEWRTKVNSAKWRAWCDAGIIAGSWISPIVWG